ncbi:N-acetylneuraminate synthase [Fusobacterium varium]|uniref:N-acetylneuraminate synthase n=1 Tax=Fusobacterium varium TaxID=856 RepID=UPI00242F30FF|nr:N-acetylneuraminate synthase [Fusobacterium varium]MCI6033935.1 N-acetylneuraminate synthase [Fusobacterium varium]
MSVFIIAEAGVNHNGNINLAYKMVDEAKKAGVDCIKFQTFKTEKIITKNTKKAEYQEKNTENKETQYEMIKKLELTYDEFRKLKKYCKEKEIIFLSTPDEEESLNFLMDELNMEMVKIGSGEITNYIYLEKIAQKNKPIILSTGMSTLGEVEKALEIIRKYNNQKITLLHCTTNYPCPIEEVNLNAMLTLKEAFKLDIGYSDHTLGIEISIAATALGATVIEKHFTLDKNLDGPDHKASLDPLELTKMVEAIRNIEKALGNGIKQPHASENKIKEVVRRKIIVFKNLKKGHILKEEDLIFKRSNNGIEAEFYKIIIGKKIKRDLKEETIISWDDLE